MSPYDTVNPIIKPLQQPGETREREYSLQGNTSETFPNHRPAMNSESTTLSEPKSDRILYASQPLTISHLTKIEEDKIKILLELKSESSGDVTYDRVPMRLVCLFDTSGSMAQKFGSRENRYHERQTKLKKMKNLAKLLTETLDERDFLGILSFGDDAEILWPLTQNKASLKETACSRIQQLGKSGLSLTTNLSRGIFAALDMFRQDSKQRGLQFFDTRDVIVILTDGDINDGIIDGQRLVREVRKAMRDLEMERGRHSREPSITISTVVTGSNVSDAVYLLSKTCGSDSYFYIDKDTGALEIGALMPVVLRKTSTASSISIKVKCFDPAEIIPKLCSHEYMAHRPHENDDELNYFLHDLSVGMSKHLLVVLDKESVIAETDLNTEIILLEMEYRDSLMQKQTLRYSLSRKDILPYYSKPSQNVDVSIQDLRRISQIALRDVADFLKSDHPDLAVSALLQSKQNIQKGVEMFSQNDEKPSDLQKITGFVKSVTSSLTYLMDMVEDSQTSAGESWSSVKAVSSAITREAPSATKLLSQGKRDRDNESDEYAELRREANDPHSTRGIQSAIFYDFDVTMTNDLLKQNVK